MMGVYLGGVVLVVIGILAWPRRPALGLVIVGVLLMLLATPALLT